jgi:hypothetical protein
MRNTPSCIRVLFCNKINKLELFFFFKYVEEINKIEKKKFLSEVGFEPTPT